MFRKKSIVNQCGAKKNIHTTHSKIENFKVAKLSDVSFGSNLVLFPKNDTYNGLFYS